MWDELQSWITKAMSGLMRFVLDAGAWSAVIADSFFQLMANLGRIASTYGWAFTPSFEFAFILGTAADVARLKHPRHAIYQAARDYLCANEYGHLYRIVHGMASYSVIGARRHKILVDCAMTLQMHGKGRFNAANVVLPALFAQIDGILNTFANEVGIEKWNDRKRNGPQRLRAELERVTYSFDHPALDLIFQILFAATKSEEPRLLVNRNLVLHGEWTGYGRLEHVLRAYIVLDFLGYIIEEYRCRASVGSWDVPITEKSQWSHRLSENFASGSAEFARQYLAGKGVDIGSLHLQNVVDRST